jgi:hypothetical protein
MRALSDDLCTVSDRGRQQAEALVIAAAESLGTPAKREQQTREAFDNPVRPSTKLRCPVDLDALDEYIHHPDSNVRKADSRMGVTHRSLAIHLRDRALPSLRPEPSTCDVVPCVNYVGIILVDGHGFWLRQIQHGGKWVWSDIGNTFDGNDDETWTAAVRILETATDTTLSAKPIPLRGRGDPDHSLHFVCDCTTPVTTHLTDRNTL